MFTPAKIGAVLACALALASGAAQAATVLSVDDTYPAVPQLHGSLTCVQSCEGLVSYALTPSLSSTWDSAAAKLFTVHPPSLAKETAWVNSVTGGAFTGSKTEEGGANYAFSTDALYILFKIGGGNSNATFLVHNTYGKGLQLSWSAVDAMGAGLSHYTEFGTAADPQLPAVPLPAAAPLLLTGLGAIAVLRRRFRR
jgi:hypothetical protein